MNSSLADLVYEGHHVEAIEVARDLHPRAVHRLLFLDDHRHLDDEGPAGVFVRQWYATLTSPYLRAEAAYNFADTFMTELAPYPDAEFIGARMKTDALRDLLGAVSKACSGSEVQGWAVSPEEPLTPEAAAQWKEIGRLLAALDFPPSVALSDSP